MGMDIESWTIHDEINLYKQIYKPTYKLEEGENTLVIDITSMTPVKTQFGEAIRFNVRKDNEEYALIVRRNSRLYRALMTALIKYMQKNQDAKEVNVKIIRAGKGKSVAYDVKILDK